MTRKAAAAALVLFVFGGFWQGSGSLDAQSRSSDSSRYQHNRPDPGDFFGDRSEAILQIADDMGRDQIAALEVVNQISLEARAWMDEWKNNGGSTHTREYVAFAMIDVGAEQVQKNERVIQRIQENSLLPDDDPDWEN